MKNGTFYRQITVWATIPSAYRLNENGFKNLQIVIWTWLATFFFSGFFFCLWSKIAYIPILQQQFQNIQPTEKKERKLTDISVLFIPQQKYMGRKFFGKIYSNN